VLLSDGFAVFSKHKDWHTERLRAKLIIVLSLTLLLSGCLIRSPTKLISGKMAIGINIAPDVNSSSPVAFDVVEINDKDLAKQVAQMTAADWFQKRGQIQRDFPKPGKVTVRNWEWVPGQVVPQIEIPMRRTPLALLAFANYSSAGPHRTVLDPAKNVLISLEKDDLTLLPMDSKTKSTGKAR
jgi:type VI secretion system protein